MILRYLTVVIIMCYFTKLVTCLPSGSYDPETDNKDEEEDEEETTALSDNSFPQSRFEIDEEGADAVILQSGEHQETSPDSWTASVDGELSEDELDKKGHKKGPKRKRKKNSPLQKFLPLLLIPFIIQAKIIPLFLFNLKVIAFKALMVGKLAMILVAFNMIRNMLVTNSAHVDHVDTKYSLDHVAQDHYGYNGGPEYGSWVNRRQDQPMLAYRPWEQTSQTTAWQAK